jgi:hypothetical protein
MLPVKIYINVAVINHVNYILDNILIKIQESGLQDFCQEINLIVNGDLNALFYKKNDKIKVFHKNTDISHCEFPTLQHLYEDSQKSEFKVLYLHTKGVTRYNKPIQDLIDYLIYFNITKFKDRYTELDDFDCTGVNFWGNPDDILQHPSTWGYGKVPQHYGGNFWWSNSTHISKLPSPYSWLPDSNYLRWRMMAEMWLCQIRDGKYNNAWSSEVDHYMTEYPKQLYVENSNEFFRL